MRPEAPAIQTLALINNPPVADRVGDLGQVARVERRVGVEHNEGDDAALDGHRDDGARKYPEGNANVSVSSMSPPSSSPQ
jgi:hypothetical protein